MKKVLSLDGGGIKGVFPAAFLAAIEDSIDGKVAEYFDLIVGTSTGGIIALALGLGYGAQEVLSFYERLGPTVFRGGRTPRWLRQLWAARYSSEPLRHALESQFGQRRLGESRVRLVVPALNLETGEVHIFKTAHHPRLATDYRVPVVDVALATAAAPTYFPTHKLAAGVPLVDGGLWANNPVGIAVVEAISMLDWRRGELEILSVGCTGQPLRTEVGGTAGWGLAYWGLRIVDAMLAGQSSASLGTAQHLAGHEHVERINPIVASGKYALDAVDQIESLRGLGVSEARKARPRLLRFFAEKAAPFDPCYSL